MDIQIHTAHLRDALERGQRATEHFGLLGSPGAIHLHGEGTTLSLTINGGVRTLSLRTTGRVTRAGGILLPLSDVATIIAQLPATVIRLAVDPPGRQLTITSPGLVITLQGQAPPAGPTMPSSAQWTPLGRYSAQALHHAIEQVRYAAGTDKRRPVMNGARLRVHGAQASLSAADGFRAAHTEILLAEPSAQAHDDMRKLMMACAPVPVMIGYVPTGRTHTPAHRLATITAAAEQGRWTYPAGCADLALVGPYWMHTPRDYLVLHRPAGSEEFVERGMLDETAEP